MRSRVFASLAPALAAVVVAATGCPDPAGIDPKPKPNPPTELPPCTVSPGEHSLDEVQLRFVDGIYPLMTRTDGGCIACHADDSGRQLRMALPGPNEGAATFLRLRSGGFLTRTAGSMPFRVEDDSMPEGNPKWSQQEKDLLDQLACDLAVVDGGINTPPDEQFPPELLLPYDGPAITDYDNTFVTYNQLRGRVLQVFDDEWVREGVDEFSNNIALFGGVDFISTFVPARQATSEFLSGLDLLSEDVCRRAAENGTGPFAGIDVDAAIFSEPAPATTAFEAEDPALTILNLPDGCRPGAGAREVVLCTTSSINTPISLRTGGDYIVRAVVRADPNSNGQPLLAISVDGQQIDEVEVPGSSNVTMSVTGHIDSGDHTLSVAFTNDDVDDAGDDRNLFVDSFSIEGPLPGTSGGSATGEADAKGRIQTVAERILQRPFHDDGDDATDVEGLYGVLVDLDTFEPGNQPLAWSGVCEAVMRHPDWLFARAPSFDASTSDDERERLLVTQSALLLLDRTPTDDELGRFDVGELSRNDLIDQWLDSAEHRAMYQQKVREILEFDGTPDGDEPSRLWGFIAAEDRPLREILTADYTVDDNGARVERPSEHGQTGVLTMKGYIKGKPGLPHYNYAARVLTGFMGVIFNVPQEALDARATATASSTVDPGSLCFSCHRLLTPLAHQRQRWDDDGNFRTTFDDGRVIDDSDNNLVADYPFRGTGLEAFSLVAVKKESFARRIANAHFQLAFGRLLRHEQDERTVYHSIYDAIDRGDGNFHDVMRAVLFSTSFTNPPRPTPDDAAGGGAP